MSDPQDDAMWKAIGCLSPEELRLYAFGATLTISQLVSEGGLCDRRVYVHYVDATHYFPEEMKSDLIDVHEKVAAEYQRRLAESN
jgi:hypothetical protein